MSDKAWGVIMDEMDNEAKYAPSSNVAALKARIEALEADLKVCADQLEENTALMAMARERIEALEAAQIRPHELKAMYDTVAYLRSLARIFPDKDGDTFSTKMQSYAQVIEDMVERIEAAQ